MLYKWKIVESHFSVPMGLTFFSAPRKRSAVCKSHVSRIRLGVSDMHSWGLLTQINPGVQKFDHVVVEPEQKYTHHGLPLNIRGFYIAYWRGGVLDVSYKINFWETVCYKDRCCGQGQEKELEFRVNSLIWRSGRFVGGKKYFFLRKKGPFWLW